MIAKVNKSNTIKIENGRNYFFVEKYKQGKDLYEIRKFDANAIMNTDAWECVYGIPFPTPMFTNKIKACKYLKDNINALI